MLSLAWHLEFSAPNLQVLFFCADIIFGSLDRPKDDVFESNDHGVATVQLQRDHAT